MLYDAFLTVLGLGMLLGGGDATVRGAASLARRLGISPLAIGLTVVAFGTSAPELAVNVTAAWTGHVDISFGSIFGSNMANIGLILALTALVRPLQIRSVVIRREVPMMLLATAACAALGFDALLGGGKSTFQRGDGITLLLLFTVFLYYTVNDVLAQRSDRNGAIDAEPSLPPAHGLAGSLALTAVGLALLVGGGHWTVEGATELARGFGVPENVIGLTLVAVGTSLPELTASMVATFKGHADLAVGNVVGSNVFNLLLVLALSSLIRPIPLPEGGVADVVVTGVLSLLLWLASASYGRTIIRTEASILFVVYLVYVVQRALSGPMTS